MKLTEKKMFWLGLTMDILIGLTLIGMLGSYVHMVNTISEALPVYTVKTEDKSSTQNTDPE